MHPKSIYKKCDRTIPPPPRNPAYFKKRGQIKREVTHGMEKKNTFFEPI